MSASVECGGEACLGTEGPQSLRVLRVTEQLRVVVSLRVKMKMKWDSKRRNLLAEGGLDRSGCSSIDVRSAKDLLPPV